MNYAGDQVSFFAQQPLHRLNCIRPLLYQHYLGKQQKAGTSTGFDGQPVEVERRAETQENVGVLEKVKRFYRKT